MEKEIYPEIPNIHIQSVHYTPAEGIVELTIFFTDGDGDIGLKDSETLPPYDYNLFIRLFEKNNGTYEAFQFPDSNLTFNARIPILDTKGSNKTLKGNIHYQMQFFNPKYPEPDTFKMEIHLRDRALHDSNTDRSPEFIVY